MADLIHTTGAAMLESTRQAYLVRAVAYRRGSDEVSLSMSKARSVFEVVESDGSTRQIETIDWVGVPADLVLAGSQIEPRQGDEIVDTVGARRLVYVVRGPGETAPWEPSGLDRSRIRIHTLFAREESA